MIKRYTGVTLRVNLSNGEIKREETNYASFMKKVEPTSNYSSAEFLHLFGKELSQLGIRGIVATAYENKVPVFCPAIVDSGYGIAYLLNRNLESNFNLNINQLKDFEQLVVNYIDGKMSGEQKKEFLEVLKQQGYNIEEINLSALPYPVIIAANDLLPSDTASMDRENVLGIVTHTGGTTSHTAIIARNLMN